MPREIINIGQRETGRYNYRKQTKIDLITLYLSYCVAVVFTDELGNVSLTHFDSRTDVEFLWRESAWMKGKFTVDIVKLDTVDDALANIVLNTLKQKYPDIKNSRGNQEHRKTKYGTILMRNGKLLTPTQEHVEEISPLYPDKKPGNDNPLREDKLVFPGDNISGAVIAEYERILNQNLDPKKHFPILVFNGDWTGECTKLTPTSQRIVDDYRTKKLSSDKIKMFALKCIPPYKENIDFIQNEFIPLLDQYLVEVNRPIKRLEEKKKRIGLSLLR